MHLKIRPKVIPQILPT